ncbi:uncharacterized protein LOC133533810 isoform X1 [Cydia pomonella]|uniref:uncharacterized protein LOC133533810 isoform X1 n=1 Tax=Cydia pomonella TaxID=82600 RepID=UPI002ADD3C46|nr:uncharacterized protein LOC133533810 isoform X1 [Cydia pomonella]
MRTRRLTHRTHRTLFYKNILFLFKKYNVIVKKYIIKRMDDLSVFLLNCDLIHLYGSLNDQGADLDFLLSANDHELSILVPAIVQKGKLRMALDRERERREVKNDPRDVDVQLAVAPIQKQDSFVIPSSSQKSSLSSVVTTSAELLEWDINCDDLQFIDASKLLGTTTGRSLKQILESSSIGKPLLNKKVLSSSDRKILTALIVEAEVRKLKENTDPIRKEIWDTWTSEIIKLFPGETKGVYYNPFRLVDGTAIQASGLIVNRLITVRRKLNAENRCRSRSRHSSSDKSSDSSEEQKKRKKSAVKSPARVRPFPDSFQIITTNQESEKDTVQWLKHSSSPRELVETKWNSCLHERMAALQEGDHVSYLTIFPALQCPWGYVLLASDFDKIYPEIEGKFEENFPVVKGRLLSLLDEKAEQLTRADTSIQSVLDLATSGEEQANIATFLAVPLLLKQMHTVPVKGVRRPWNPSRLEVSNAFLSLVPSTSDLQSHFCKRKATLQEKKLPVLPYLVAIGACWQDVKQYDLLISEDIRYTFPSICKAISNTFKILWALDLPYSKDCAPVWMFIQRSIYVMKSKFDTEGTPMLDLLASVSNRHDGAVCNM